jgi:hypothetical protein
MILYQRGEFVQAEAPAQRGLLVAPSSPIGKYCLGLVYLAIRPVEADYFLTRFINDLTTGHRNQNSFRYQAGLVFEF